MNKYRIWYQRGSRLVQTERYNDVFARDEAQAKRHFWQHYQSPASSTITRVELLYDIAHPTGHTDPVKKYLSPNRLQQDSTPFRNHDEC